MLHPPVENPGAVVAVRFTSEEFQRLSQAAQRTGVRTTEFIHAAALACAGEQFPASSAKPSKLARPRRRGSEVDAADAVAKPLA
jgi:hypothetical protein